MTYEQIVDKISHAFPMYHRIGSSAYKEGLENIETLMDLLHHPEEHLRTIHIAGTNGKGSTAHLLSSFYQEMGWKVGLYTSPHLVDFRERIRINGEMISQKEVVDFFEMYQSDFQKIEPSFFEMATALALYCFQKEKVDIAIIEVGLGGRLDSTNVIHPDLSVITNISLDHTQLLGDTLDKIAVEKAGIIKAGVPVVIGRKQPETLPVFTQRAKEVGAPLYTTTGISVTDAGKETGGASCRTIRIVCEGIVIQPVKLPLPGDYQLENVATFVAAARIHQPDLPVERFSELIRMAIEHVLTNTHLQGRWQVIEEHPLVICDTGHNSGGFAYISQQLNRIQCSRLYIILGFVNDKDIDAIVHLLPHHAEYHICKASVERAQEPAIIAQKLAAAGIFAQCETTSVHDTYLKVRRLMKETDTLYIGGSTFIVADLLKNLH